MKTIVTKEISKTKRTNPLIYTDGSLSQEGSGIDINITNARQPNRYIASSKKLINHKPITSIELSAIEKALELAEQNQIRNPILYTDSQAACRIIDKN